MIEQVHQWDADRTDRLVVTAFPADVPDDQLAEGQVIDKRQVPAYCRNDRRRRSA